MIRSTIAHRAVAAAFLIVTAAITAAAAPPPPEARPIVRFNQVAAGAGTARFLNIYPGIAAVNDHGQVAFVADLFGSGINSSNNQGVWLNNVSTGINTLIARFGTRPPGLPTGTRYDWYFESLDLNNAGAVAFVAGIEPAIQPVEIGAWTSGGGALHLLAAERYPIPGALDATPLTGGVYFPLLNDAGQTAFLTNLNNPTLWVDTPGQPLRRVVSAGDSLPGAIGLHVKSLGRGLIDANGRLAFAASMVDLPNDTNTIDGIWSESGGSLQLVAREGGPLPDGSGTMHSFNSLAMNAAGTLAMDVNLTSPSDARALTVWHPDGSARFVVQTNQPIAGSPHTIDYYYDPTINAQGHVAFLAYVAGLPNASLPTSVWAENNVGLELIAHAGESAPGAGNAVFEQFESVQLNDFGEALIEAYLTQGIGGVTHENDEGLWLRTRNGRLALIAREGGLMDILPGPGENVQQIFAMETIEPLPNLLTNERRTLTNSGQVLFHASFHSGITGLFLTQPVPEPSTIALAAAATLALAPHRRRRS